MLTPERGSAFNSSEQEIAMGEMGGNSLVGVAEILSHERRKQVISGSNARVSGCLLYPVVSTGRRNTLAKSLCWRLEVQRFSGPLVELARHLVQLSLRVRREVNSLGEVLAQQAIGVFV